MEEFFLCAFLSRKELDVVDQEKVSGAVFGAELDGPIVADGVDELVGEPLRGQIDDAVLLEAPADFLSHRMEQVRLPEPDASVDEERVVRPTGQFRDRLAGRFCKLARGADDKALERIAGVQPDDSG